MRRHIALAAGFAVCIASQLLAREPATQSQLSNNAALQYWQAFSYLANKPEPFADIMPGELGADQAVRKLLMPVKLLRRAAEMNSCDWGIDYHEGFHARVLHLPLARQLAAGALLWARQAMSVNRFEHGLEVTTDVLVLARHTAADRLLVSVSTGYQIEADVSKQLGTQLAGIPKDKLPGFVQRLNALPPMPSYAEVMRMEHYMLLRSIERGSATRPATAQPAPLTEMPLYTPLPKDDPRVAAVVAGWNVLFDEAIRIEQLPPDQWPAADEALRARLKEYGKGVEGTAFNTTRTRQTRARGRVQFSLLQAAIAVAQDGPDAASRFTDPYGNSIKAQVMEDGAVELSSDMQLRKPLFLRLEPAPKSPARATP